jgi:hypothetical protein
MPPRVQHPFSLAGATFLLKRSSPARSNHGNLLHIQMMECVHASARWYLYLRTLIATLNIHRGLEIKAKGIASGPNTAPITPQNAGFAPRYFAM